MRALARILGQEYGLKAALQTLSAALGKETAMAGSESWLALLPLYASGTEEKEGH